MPGIFDNSPMDPKTQGILQAAFALMQASGPSRLPVSTGEAIGQAGTAGLKGYEAAEQGQLRDLQAKKLKMELDMQQGLMGDTSAAGGIGELLKDPNKMIQIGTLRAIQGHPAGAAMVNAGEKILQKQNADAQFQTMKSGEGRSGLFGTLAESPYVGGDAKAMQAALDAAKTSDPETWLRHYERLRAAHQSATDKAALADNRTANLPKSEHVIQDRASPTGWSYEDTRTGVRTPGAPPPPSTSSAIPNDVIPPQHKDLHGDDYLQTLPTGRAALLKQIAEGKQSMSAASMRYGNKEVLAQQLAQYDPSYTQARKGVWDDFTKGKSAQNSTAINTVIAHAGTVSELTDALQNKDLRLVNALINRFRTETGKPEINNAETAIQAMGNEMMRVFRQVQASEQETKAWESRFNAAKNSPAQLKGALQTGAKLLEGRIDALKDQFDRGMDNAGREKAGLSKIDFALLSPQSQAALAKLGIVRKDVPLTPDATPAATAQPKRRAYNPATGRIE